MLKNRKTKLKLQYLEDIPLSFCSIDKYTDLTPATEQMKFKIDQFRSHESINKRSKQISSFSSLAAYYSLEKFKIDHFSCSLFKIHLPTRRINKNNIFSEQMSHFQQIVLNHQLDSLFLKSREIKKRFTCCNCCMLFIQDSDYNCFNTWHICGEFITFSNKYLKKNIVLFNLSLLCS